MSTIIGVAGKMGCGKDYLAHHVIIPLLQGAGLRCTTLCFADQLKINAMVHQDIPFDGVFVHKTPETRALLQSQGTEAGRDVYGKDIWIRYFDAWKQLWQHRGVDAVVCTDIRFRNEVEYIQRQPGAVLMKIVSPLRTMERAANESCRKRGALHHSSETDIDSIPDDAFDIVVSNDPGDDLRVTRRTITHALRGKGILSAQC